MSEDAVRIESVSKRFRLYHERYTSLLERARHGFRVPHEDLWAVDDVSFSVAEGETIGILGRNGSGKSTLLKCICGVLQPTSGQVVQRGRLAGLLELGAGFQQELSGRDNVFLNGSLLGFSRRDMEKRFDEIVAFAELEQFIDNQVKFYSSGMYVRLGFAVAVNIDPDILVIDEVLAVGDERFQRKCLERVREFKEEGRTIILVSHAPDQVRSICDRAMVMQSGRMLGMGSPGEAVRLFREHLLEADMEVPTVEDAAAGVSTAPPRAEEEVPRPDAAETTTAHTAWTDRADTEVDDEKRAVSDEDIARGPNGWPVRLDRVSVAHAGMEEGRHLRAGEPVTVRVDVDVAEPIKGLGLVLEIRNLLGDVVYATDAGTTAAPLSIPAGPGVVDLDVERFPLLDGAFVVGVGARVAGQVVAWAEDACRLEVMNPGRDMGMVALNVRAAVLPGEAVLPA